MLPTSMSKGRSSSSNSRANPKYLRRIIKVVGIILCLHAATKICHRAQNMALFTSRWHALATCASAHSQTRTCNRMGNLQNSRSLNSLPTIYSESDLESLGYVSMPTSAQLTSYMSLYHKRQPRLDF